MSSDLCGLRESNAICTASRSSKNHSCPSFKKRGHHLRLTSFIEPAMAHGNFYVQESVLLPAYVLPLLVKREQLAHSLNGNHKGLMYWSMAVTSSTAPCLQSCSIAKHPSGGYWLSLRSFRDGFSLSALAFVVCPLQANSNALGWLYSSCCHCFLYKIMDVSLLQTLQC